MKNNKKLLFSILMAFNTFLSIISFFSLNSTSFLNNINGLNGNYSNYDNINIYSNDYQNTSQWIKDPSFDYIISGNWTYAGTLTTLQTVEGLGLVDDIF